MKCFEEGKLRTETRVERNIVIPREVAIAPEEFEGVGWKGRVVSSLKCQAKEHVLCLYSVVLGHDEALEDACPLEDCYLGLQYLA